MATELSRPPFVADWNSITRDTGHTIDWDAVGEEFRQTPGGKVTTTAIAAQGATSVTVTALPIALAGATVLSFGGAKFARLTAPAAVGATSLTVAALPTALASGDVAPVAGSGPKSIPAGTRMGDAGVNGRVYPRVAGTNPAKMILATNAREGENTGTRDSYGVMLSGVLYENLLPGSTGTPKTILAAEKTELAEAGCFFTFTQYRDSTA